MIGPHKRIAALARLNAKTSTFGMALEREGLYWKSPGIADAVRAAHPVLREARRPVPAAPFTTRSAGVCMAPLVQPGDWTVCDPRRHAVPGDLVAIVMREPNLLPGTDRGIGKWLLSPVPPAGQWDGDLEIFYGDELGTTAATPLIAVAYIAVIVRVLRPPPAMRFPSPVPDVQLLERPARPPLGATYA
jgi:hypothetical protein